MSTPYTSLIIGMSLLFAALGSSTAQAQTERRPSGTHIASADLSSASSTQEAKRAAPAVSSSLEAAPDDVTALSAAGKSGDKDQVRALLLKHGFTAEQLAACDVEVLTIVSPRDAASGLPTGKRIHKPAVGGNTDADSSSAIKIKVTITVSIKPPKIIITIVI